VGAIFCRKCGVQLTAAPQPMAPLSPPQVIYVNQPGVPPRASKTSRFGCGTLILVLVAGCCLWSVFAYFMQDKATIERSTTTPLKQESTPPPAASGWQAPPAEERQDYENRIAAKVESMVASGTIQVYFPQRTVYINPQVWDQHSPQEKKAEWEAFREYFRIKTGSREVRILSSTDGRELR
jgi:hypothetical protein